nr:LysR substrate-binding domain-containing protein [Tomitella biformata]
MRHLAAFVAVADAGTISGAAERLHLSQSSVSAAVTELERALRAQLCIRRRAHGVQLTPTGEAVLDRARALLRQAGDLEDVATGAQGLVSGPLAIGCYPSLGPTMLPSLLYEFTARYPGVNVEFHEDTQNRLHGRLEGGELDLVIVYELDLPDEWHRVRLASRQPSVFFAADQPLAAGDGPIDLAALREEPMVLLDSPPSAQHALQLCAEAGFGPRIAFRTHNYETARAFVGRGLGWTILVQRPRLDVTYEGLPLVARLIGNPVVADVSVVIAWPQRSTPSRAARAFIKFATEREHPSK